MTHSNSLSRAHTYTFVHEMGSASTTALEVTVRILVASICVFGIAAYLTLHTAGVYDLCVGPRRVYLGNGIVTLLSETLSSRPRRVRHRLHGQRRARIEDQSETEHMKDTKSAPPAQHISRLIAPRLSNVPSVPSSSQETDVLRITDGKASAAREMKSSVACARRFEALDSLYDDAAFCVERAIDDSNTSSTHYDSGIRVCDIDERTRMIFLFGTSSLNEAREGLDISHTDWTPEWECKAPLRAHAGFVRAYTSHRIKERINRYIDTGLLEIGAGARFVIAGHSRGAVFAALLAAERSLCTAVANPLNKVVCPRTRVRFLMYGSPKVFDPATTERLRATKTFREHVLVIQHANDVVPQLPLATTHNQLAITGGSSGSSPARSAEIVAYSAVERLVPHAARLFTCTPSESESEPPALQIYHELETYASSLRTEAGRIQSRARALSHVSRGKMPSFAPWRDFLWTPKLKSKQD